MKLKLTGIVVGNIEPTKKQYLHATTATSTAIATATKLSLLR